jgi:hypothetical protein
VAAPAYTSTVAVAVAVAVAAEAGVFPVDTMDSVSTANEAIIAVLRRPSLDPVLHPRADMRRSLGSSSGRS